MKKSDGFTMVELMIVILLISILSAFAIPNFVRWLPNYRLKSAANDLFSSFQAAKLSAIKSNTYCTILFTRSGGVINGYDVFIDTDKDFVRDGGETLVKSALWSDYKDVSDNGTATFTADSIAFRPNGIPVDSGGGFANGSITLKNTNDKTATITVSQAGNVRITLSL